MEHPCISIIVIAYNIENFIEQALHSCIFPGYNDYEVIVIDNASSDGTLDMIKRVSEQYPGRFCIIENANNIGPGEGRNRGMATARGEYILFLDGDDWFAPTAYPRLRSLIEDKSFDLCFFRHQRVWNTGTREGCAYGELFFEGYRTGEERDTAFFKFWNTPWNKLYKRAFLEKHRFAFDQGIYEDVSWTHDLLIHAEEIYVIPDELYLYRQRPGSFCRSRGREHFDIIAQYRKVFECFAADSGQEQWGWKLYLWARTHLFSVIQIGDRIPRGAEKEFMLEADRLLTDYRKAIGKEWSTLRERALATHNIHWYMAVHKFLTAYIKNRKKLLRFCPWLKSWKNFHNHLLVLLYKHVLVKYSSLDENRILFESFWGQKMDCNPHALSKKLAESGPFECIWSLNSPQDAEKDHRFTSVKRNSWAFWKAAATSKYLITNANFPGEMIKREGQIMVGTQHGTPLKFMGLDLKEIKPKETSWNAFARRTRRHDFLLSSNRHSTRIWRQSNPFNYKLLESGYPRNDVLFNTNPDLVASVREQLGVPPGSKVALYAPTFRDSAESDHAHTGGRDFDPVVVRQALGDEFVLLMRSHYFLSSDALAESEEGIIDANAFTRTNELLLCVDLLITDYSSIMFDYACLKRPIVLYCFDYDKYAARRGVYFDIREKAPGPVTASMEELTRCLREKSYDAEDSQERLLTFNKEFCEFDDGHATERVINTIFKHTH